MSFGSMRMALLMCALALMPAALRAQPADEVASLNQTATPQPSPSNLDVPIGEIAAASGGCAILDKDFPGLRTNAMYSFAKSMTLHDIAAMSHGKITPAMLAQAQADLSTLHFQPVATVQQADDSDLDRLPTGGQASLTASYPK